MDDDWDVGDDGGGVAQLTQSCIGGRAPQPLLPVRALPRRCPRLHRHRRLLPPHHRRGVGLTSSLSVSTPTIRLASDCTGLNAAGIALEALGFNVVSVFASEIDTKTRAVLVNNFDVGDIYGDICVRDDSRLSGQVDLYTAGPPCQPFSSDGRHGDARGLAFLRVLETVGEVRPRAFVIENVKGLLSARHAALREHIIGHLQNLRGPDGKRFYKIRMRVLDTKIIGGLPQSRPRVYIVGWRRAEERMAFTWPAPLRCVSFSSLVERRATTTTLAVRQGRGLSARAKRAVIRGEEEARRRGGNPAEEPERRWRRAGKSALLSPV